MRQRNYGLDLARCTAVSLLFFSHSFNNLVTADIPFVWYLAPFGLESFFSLSGFLIGRMLITLFNDDSNQTGFKKVALFWTRRWFRTLPLYFILYPVYLVAYNLLSSPVSFDWRYFLFLHNFSTYPPRFFGESWSLSIEEWSYFAIPVLLFMTYSFFGNRKERSSRLFHPFLITVILLIAVQIIVRANNPDCKAWNCTAVVFRFDAIAYGLIGAYISKLNPNIDRRRSLLLIFGGFFLSFIAAIIRFTLSDITYYYQLYFLISGPGTTLIIMGLYYYRFKKKFRAVFYISSISYSIYLTHRMAVVLPLELLANHYGWRRSIFLWIISIVLTLLIASLTFRFIETPFMKLRDRLFPERSRP